MTIVELLHLETGRPVMSAGFGDATSHAWGWIVDSLRREHECEESDIACVEMDDTDPRDRVSVRGVVVAEIRHRPSAGG